jgi:hypothetical protein
VLSLDSDDNRVWRSSASDFGISGITVTEGVAGAGGSDDNRIERSSFVRNMTFGIALEQNSDDSRLGQNRAIANQLDGIFVDSPSPTLAEAQMSPTRTLTTGSRWRMRGRRSRGTGPRERRPRDRGRRGSHRRPLQHGQAQRQRRSVHERLLLVGCSTSSNPRGAAGFVEPIPRELSMMAIIVLYGDGPPCHDSAASGTEVRIGQPRLAVSARR